MKIFANIKLWIIIALIVVLTGAVMISVFGLNNTPDYKSAYEVTVGVDQNVKGSGDIVKKAAEDYFKEKGYGYSCYATQKTADGTEYIYKFNGAGNINVNELKNDKILPALNADADLAVLGLAVKAEYKQTEVSGNVDVLKVILACVIGLILVFLISLFTVKAASALMILINAIMTAVLYVMILAITRIPAYPDLVICGAAGIIISAIMTFVLTCRFKEILQTNGTDVKAVAEEGLKCGAARLLFIACAGIVAAIVLSAAGGLYVTFTGLKIVVATCSAYLVSCVATPALWTVLKTAKGKK